MGIDEKKLIKLKKVSESIMESCDKSYKHWRELEWCDKIIVLDNIIGQYNYLVNMFHLAEVKKITRLRNEKGYLAKMIHNCRLMISLIDVELGEWEDIGVYNKLLESYIKTSEFEFDENLIKKIPEGIGFYLIEALVCFRNGAYTACCSMCGNVLFGIISSECKKHKIKEKQDYGKKVDSLSKIWIKRNKNIKRISKKLMELTKQYRDFANHPSKKKYTKDEASLFLSTIRVLCNEIY